MFMIYWSIFHLVLSVGVFFFFSFPPPNVGVSGVQQYLGVGAGEERIPRNVRGVQGRHP